MKCSESIVKLAVALSKAQGEMENAGKKSTNPHFKSKYADLAEIVNTARPVLTKHGISLIQIPSFDGQVASVETILLHESGEWLSGISSSPLQKQDPQGIGSATTYLRRYAAAAMCFLAQEDDDANSAGPRQQTVQVPPKPEPKATKAQVDKIVKLMRMDEKDALSHVHDILNAVKPIAKFKDFGCVTSRMADYVINELEALMRDAQQKEQAEADADARAEKRSIENKTI